jgi:hypothetical protein
MKKPMGDRRIWRICAASLLAASLTTLIVSQAYGATNGKIAATAATTTTTTSASTSSTTTTLPSSVAPTTPGSASASSQFLTVGPQFGGFNLSVSAGQSAASLQGSDANASSQDVYLGLLGSTLGVTSPCTTPTGPSALCALSALTADSAGGAASLTGNPPASGMEAVSVNPSGPESASAETTPVSVGIPGLLELIGQATASVTYTAGKSQEADAKTIVSVNIGNGLVTLEGLTWMASQRFGTSPVNSGSFTVADIAIGATQLPILNESDLASAVSLANVALGVLGISLILPTTGTDADTGAITVGALDVRLTGTAATNALLEPVLAQEPAIEQLINSSIASTGELATLAGDGELVGDIVLGVLAGAGQVNLYLGGVSASSTVAPAGFQFGAASSSSSPNSFGSAASGGTFLPSSGTTFPSSLGAVASPGTSTTIPTRTTTALPASVPAGLVHCVTTSPSGRPGCWRNAGGVVAGALLAGGAALFAIDFVQGRRRRFERPKESTL